MLKALISPRGSPSFRVSAPQFGQVLLVALVAALATFLASLEQQGNELDFGSYRWAWDAAIAGLNAGLVWLAAVLLPDTSQRQPIGR